MTINLKKTLISAGLIVAILVSIFVISGKVSTPEFHAKTIQSLESKNETVKELALAAAATSAAITLIPGDAGTPIAEELADLSTYFLIIISALYLEKYLLTITGFAAFAIIIPIALGLFILYTLRGNPTVKRAAIKLLAFGIAIVMVIPVSIKASDVIESTYQDSIQETLDTATNTAKEIEKDTAAEAESQGNWLSNTIDQLKDKVSANVDHLESILNRFLEALAVMIVTSCAIPIVVLLAFVWLSKSLLNIDIPIPTTGAFAKKAISNSNE